MMMVMMMMMMLMITSDDGDDDKDFPKISAKEIMKCREKTTDQWLKSRSFQMFNKNKSTISWLK